VERPKILTEFLYSVMDRDLAFRQQGLGQDVKTMPAAWEIYDHCCADERIAFLPEPEGLDPRLRSFSRSHEESPKLWAEAYLAAFASVAGLRLVTFDKAFRSKPVDCLVLE